ncbi:MAG: NUDIX hydrolase [Thermodesulfobacteriota bacterium]
MSIAARWTMVRSRIIDSYRIFNLREDRYRLPRNQQEAPFYILESRDWVNVIPLTEAGEVVLIRQYRFGIEEVCLEIPGGIVDEGFTPLAAGQKELLEETGYQAQQWEYLGFVHPNPAFLNNRCHSFLARGVTKVADITLEESEEIEVQLVPFSEIKGLIAKGEITHSLVICAFHLQGLRKNS